MTHICKRCGLEIQRGTGDPDRPAAYHAGEDQCIDALSARIKELEEQLNECCDRLRDTGDLGESAIQKAEARIKELEAIINGTATIEQIAKHQGVSPVKDIDELYPDLPSLDLEKSKTVVLGPRDVVVTVPEIGPDGECPAACPLSKWFVRRGLGLNDPGIPGIVFKSPGPKCPAFKEGDHE